MFAVSRLHDLKTRRRLGFFFFLSPANVHCIYLYICTVSFLFIFSFYTFPRSFFFFYFASTIHSHLLEKPTASIFLFFSALFSLSQPLFNLFFFFFCAHSTPPLGFLPRCVPLVLARRESQARAHTLAFCPAFLISFFFFLPNFIPHSLSYSPTLFYIFALFIF